MLVYDPDPQMRYHIATSFAKILALKPLNADVSRERVVGDLWSYVDPAHLAKEDTGKFFWSLLL
jgi:hypothetical protein